MAKTMNEKHNLDPKVREVYEKAGIDLDEVAKSAAKTYKEWKREHLPSPLRRLARFFSREVIPFQCNHCGETLYAPSEEEMEIMMEKHLHASHPEET
jgi:8-oxo-dGTP pyrophosphatase MutT (NUDIX family)